MRTHPANFLLIAMALFFVSCKQSGVSLEQTNAKGEVPPLGNLVFRFNKALHPDSLLNNWDSTEYLSFEPSIPGRVGLGGAGELVF